MSTGGRVVVVGAGLAGASVAVQLRRVGHDGEVVLVGAEPHLPYERPALSKTHLTGQSDATSLLLQPAAAYDDLGVELRLGRAATRLDVDDRSVSLDGGERVPYDALVLATGARNVRPPIPGIDLRGVHQLRTLDDADALREGAERAQRAVVVGMGFIGCEVAAALRQRGLDVTVVDRLAGPLLPQLGQQLSETVAAWHRDHGVRLVGGAAVAELVGRDHVEGVRLQGGDDLAADLVVVAVGVRPDTAWLTDTPLHLVRGAVGVDSAGRTSAPDVYAAGDVTAVWDPLTRTHRHVEHYRSAVEQAQRVAHAVVGAPLPDVREPWFWSDQYEHTLHYAGDRSDLDDVHRRPDGRETWFVRGGRLAAVATVDDPRAFRRALRRLGDDVQSPDLLDDPGAPRVATVAAS